MRTEIGARGHSSSTAEAVEAWSAMWDADGSACTDFSNEMLCADAKLSKKDLFTQPRRS